jgi:ubiquilin
MTSIKLKIKPTSGGDVFEVNIGDDATIEALKEEVSKACDAPAPQIRLIFKGQILKDPQTVASYGLKNDFVVHMVKSKQPAPTGGASAPPASAPPSTATASRGAASLPPPLGLGASMNAAGLPNLNEEQLSAMMDSPLMRSVLNNPELLRSMLENNPMFRSLSREHPELQALLQDPTTLANMMRSMSDPVRIFASYVPLKAHPRTASMHNFVWPRYSLSSLCYATEADV